MLGQRCAVRRRDHVGTGFCAQSKDGDGRAIDLDDVFLAGFSGQTGLVVVFEETVQASSVD